MASREALVVLNMLPKIGPVRVRRLMDVFGSAESILSASIGKLTGVDGIGPETAEIIRGWEERIDLRMRPNGVTNGGKQGIEKTHPDNVR